MTEAEASGSAEPAANDRSIAARSSTRETDVPGGARVLAGFIRMHVLHHAAEGHLFGHWMIEELRHHGYNISAGTLYPMLRAMERDGWIAGREEKHGAHRRLYGITPNGRAALKEARAR